MHDSKPISKTILRINFGYENVRRPDAAQQHSLFYSEYQTTFPGDSRCSTQFVRSGADVCQLRIDFLDFSLAQPSGDGACSSGFLFDYNRWLVARAESLGIFHTQQSVAFPSPANRMRFSFQNFVACYHQTFRSTFQLQGSRQIANLLYETCKLK